MQIVSVSSGGIHGRPRVVWPLLSDKLLPPVDVGRILLAEYIKEQQPSERLTWPLFIVQEVMRGRRIDFGLLLLRYEG